MSIKTEKRIRLKKKIRSKIFGTLKRPRLSVFRSNKFVYAQIVNDEKGETLLQANDKNIKEGTKTDKAKKVGEMIAKKAKEKNIKEVIFDRNGFKYTGRVKLVAEEARKGGLKF